MNQDLTPTSHGLTFLSRHLVRMTDYLQRKAYHRFFTASSALHCDEQEKKQIAEDWVLPAVQTFRNLTMDLKELEESVKRDLGRSRKTDLERNSQTN